MSLLKAGGPLFFALFYLMPSAALFSGCTSHDPLVPLVKPTPPPPAMPATIIEGSFCATNTITSQGLKFYFIIDVTGSNQNNGLLAASDPGKVLRTQAMQDLATLYPDAEFALQTFASASSGGTNSYWAFTDSTDFINTTLTQFQQVPDVGGTAYDAPLNVAATNISSYINQQLAYPATQRDPVGPIVVMFISDGEPNTGDYSLPTLTNLTNNLVVLPIKLNALSVVNEVLVDSAGYGADLNPGGASSPIYLQTIAQAGGGNFILYAEGAKIDLTELRIPSPPEPVSDTYSLIATNMNTIWETDPDGSVHYRLDSDGDGLSDYRESQLGSFPNNPDSDGNGLGDGVEYTLFNSPCQLPGCANAGTKDTRVLTSCGAIPASDGGATGHFANDILNNCEKIVAGADYMLFSFIDDKVPDGIKLRNGISPKDNTLSQVGPDGMTTLTKLIDNLPWNIQYKPNAGYTPIAYTITPTASQGSRKCYTFEVDNMAMIGTDKIRLWLIESDASSHDNLRVADIVASPNQTTQVTDSQFTPGPSPSPTSSP